MNMEETRYKQHQGLIINLAIKYARHSQIPLEDLISVGNEAYCRANWEYCSQLASFSTYLTIIVRTDMIRFCTREYCNTHSRLVEEQTYLRTPLDELLFAEMINDLSTLAREVIDVVLNYPKELQSCAAKNKVNRLTLIKYLSTKGWKHIAIRSVLDEIQKTLKIM